MNLQLGRAFRIVMQTMPYVMYRAMVYGAICGILAIVLLFLALIGRVFGGAAAGVLFIILLVGGGFGARLLREYVLYLLRAGHVAVMTEIIETGSLPEGVSQTQWGKEKVIAHFKEVSVLAFIDQLVKGVIKALNRRLFNIMSIFPIPGMDGAKKVVGKIVDNSLTYVDESILAHTFRTKSENVYSAAQSGIILYCQAWKGLLTNAVALTILCYVSTIVCALIFLVPLGAIAVMLPETWGFAKFGLFVLALFMGFSLKWILFDPIACAATILTFLNETKDMTPDPTWNDRIESVSSRFRELKDKAASYTTQEAPAEPSTTEPAEDASEEPPASAEPEEDDDTTSE